VGRQWETSEKGLREGGHTIQQRQTRKKTSWERSSNTLAGRMEAEPCEGRRAIQQREVKLGDKLGDELGDKLGNKLGDKLGDKADKASGHHATKGSKN
jgi:NTP pyrophosphatase (non-canonical NTP hydrolase)